MAVAAAAAARFLACLARLAAMAVPAWAMADSLSACSRTRLTVVARGSNHRLAFSFPALFICQCLRKVVLGEVAVCLDVAAAPLACPRAYAVTHLPQHLKGLPQYKVV